VFIDNKKRLVNNPDPPEILYDIQYCGKKYGLLRKLYSGPPMGHVSMGMTET
jgi:hypothetical protein